MKILIVNNNMQVGGIQKSLVNLLSEIPDRHEITLFLFCPDGNLMDCIDNRVKIIKGNFFTRIMGMSQGESVGYGKATWLFRGACAAMSRVFGAGFVYSLLSRFHKLPEEYDVAISYMQNSDNKTFYGGCNEFVLSSVKARKKIGFVHCDFKNYPGNNPYNRSLYEKFDTVACVSESVKAVFSEECPVCAGKVETVYNMYDFEYMQRAAEEYEVPLSDGKTVLFTSARISEEKGILRMIPILSHIKRQGGKFVWYIAGYGPESEKAKQMAKDEGMDDCIVFLGLTANPYPYFKNADMVLVPSYNEAAPMVYMEAQFFGTPVFTTDTTSAHELVDENNGVIVENNDGAIQKALSELILSPEKINALKPCLDVTNKKAREQFEKILR